MMPRVLQNNFNNFKADFLKDTKLDADKNMTLYIAYYNARCSDYAFQMTNFILQELGFMPDYIASKLSGLIKKG